MHHQAGYAMFKFFFFCSYCFTLLSEFSPGKVMHCITWYNGFTFLEKRSYGE